jgi:hypothetical protein
MYYWYWYIVLRTLVTPVSTVLYKVRYQVPGREYVHVLDYVIYIYIYIEILNPTTYDGVRLPILCQLLRMSSFGTNSPLLVQPAAGFPLLGATCHLSMANCCGLMGFVSRRRLYQ